MGSPLTITTTVCACNCDPTPIRIRVAATLMMRRERRGRNEVVMVDSVSDDVISVGGARANIPSGRTALPVYCWRPLAPPAAAVLPSVRRPIASMTVWFSEGGVVPAEYAYEVM